jgi:hypothetical protein
MIDVLNRMPSTINLGILLNYPISRHTQYKNPNWGWIFVGFPCYFGIFWEFDLGMMGIIELDRENKCSCGYNWEVLGTCIVGHKI